MRTRNKISVKFISAILLVALSSSLFSCGNKENRELEEIIETEDLEQIRAEKARLGQQQSELSAKIDQLDEAIKRLDKSRRLDLVTTMTLKDTVFKHYAEVQGDVTTDENILIYPEFSGILSQLNVREGQQVQRGQVLARIDDGGLSSELAQLEARATLAKTTFERQERLWNQNIGSEIQYLEAKTNFEALQNSVNQLKSQISKTVVRAPFSGVIDEVISEEGEVVNPGQNALFRLINLNNMYIRAAVPESYLNQIEVGSDVQIELASSRKRFDGKVRQVGNFINPNNRSFNVQIDVPKEAGNIKPNQIATIHLNDYSAENSIIIPENSLLTNALGESLVYVLEISENDDTGTAKQVQVETGYNYDGKVEILSGLEPGQELIVEGARNLRDGQEVQIRN